MSMPPEGPTSDGFAATHKISLTCVTYRFALLSQPTASAADQVDYLRDVVPILESYCIGCHTADDAEGGLGDGVTQAADGRR